MHIRTKHILLTEFVNRLFLCSEFSRELDGNIIFRHVRVSDLLDKSQAKRASSQTVDSSAFVEFNINNTGETGKDEVILYYIERLCGKAISNDDSPWLSPKLWKVYVNGAETALGVSVEEDLVLGNGDLIEFKFEFTG